MALLTLLAPLPGAAIRGTPAAQPSCRGSQGTSGRVNSSAGANF
jgi:hypothetical protein